MLRNYGTPGQYGVEATVDEWVGNLRAVCSEISRVLKPTGSLWLNVGDSYSRHERAGALPKSLLAGPERLVRGLIEDGWRLRNKVAWVKSNPVPASVGDRLTCSWEPIYFLVRSRHYFFDLDAIRVPHTSKPRVSPSAARRAKQRAVRPSWAGPLAGTQDGLDKIKARGRVGHVLGKNPSDVITTASSNYRGAHFATFPERLVERLLIASVPEKVCQGCGQPWTRERARQIGHVAVIGAFRANCTCGAPTLAGLVLDPFIGAGTVAVVAQRHERRWLGIELNPEFAQLAEDRVASARRHRREAA
jgi:DNA modification methylase